MPDNETQDQTVDIPEDQDVETEEVESDEDDSDSERNKKELLTPEKIVALMSGDPLSDMVVAIFRQLESNVELGKSAGKANAEGYSDAVRKYNEANPEESSAWLKRNDELESTLAAVKQKIAEHKAEFDKSVEPYRSVADVDLGNVNERHRAMKRSLFGFLTTAGVSDVDTAYRVPELPVAVKISTGWAPRLGKITVNGEDIQYSGDNPTLTDLNKALGIKGEQGQGATWANLFGTRDVPTSGLSINREIQKKNFKIVIFPR